MNKFLLILFFCISGNYLFSQTTCADADPFCTSTGVTFPASTSTSAPSGPNYSCLFSQPNPAWYYLNISSSGNIQINLTNSNNVDIDFIIWGPFASQGAMCTSIFNGTAGVVDCSYSASSNEQVDIPNAVAGQWYMLLITNFSGQNTNITAAAGNAAGTDGTTNCAILCTMNSLSATPGACNSATNTYNLNGTINVTNPPTTGTLTITNSCSGTPVVMNPPFTNTINYSFNNLPASGAACSVTATFSADPTCSLTQNYNAPPSCAATCFMSFLDVQIGFCDPATNTYQIDGSVEFSDPPTTGQLIIETCGGTQAVFNPPFTSPLNYSILNIPADATPNCDVTAYFTADPSCSLTVGPFTEPECVCNMDLIDITINACDGATSTYSIDFIVNYTSPPATGQLIVENCSGDQVVFNPPFGAGVNGTITGITADGTPNCSVTAYFTDDAGCTITSPTFNEQNCFCPADAGTFTATVSGNTNTNYILCEGDQITIAANGDYTPPNNVNDPTVPYNPGIWYLIYSCTPSVFSPDDITTDPCLLGVVEASATITDVNDLSLINSFPAGTFTNNTVYIVPITMYDVVNGYYSVTNYIGECYDFGQLFEITYLPPITTSSIEDCAAGTVTVTVNGGHPEIFGTSFVAASLLPANASFVNTSTTNGGNIVITGLTDGQNYSFTITDDMGCPHLFSGGPFDGPDIPVISPAGPFCTTDPAVNLTSTFPGGTWSGPGTSSAGNFNPATAGTGSHQVIYQAPGCASSDTITIIVNANVTASINPAGPFCQNDAAVFLSGSPAGGTWSGPGIVGSSSGEFSPSAAGPGTHTILYAFSGTCGDTATVSIQVDANNIAVITPVNPLCTGDAAIGLTASLAGGTWSGPGTSSTGIFDPSVAGAGSHQIIYDVGGCNIDDTITISVGSTITASINPAGPYCQDNPNTTLAGTPAGGVWGGTGITNSSTGEFSPTIAGPGFHTISYMFSGACGDTAQITIQVIDNADATIVPAGPFCITDPAVNLSSAEPSGVWSGNGITSAANGTFDPATAGVGTTTITYSISGVCGDVQTINIVVIDTANTDMLPVGPFCVDDPAVNITTATPGGTFSGNGVSPSGTFDPASAGPGTHTITYTISGNCGNSSTIDIEVNPLPVISISVDSASGCSPLTATFTNTSGFIPSNCTWSIEGTPASGDCSTFTSVFTNPGCYDITFASTDDNGCSSSVTMNDLVCVFPNPVAEFIFTPQDATVLNPQVNFTDYSLGADFYNWDFAGLGSSTAQNPSFVFPTYEAGSYDVCLTVSTINGCVDDTCHIVNIYDEFLVYVPNTFTPDFDDVNDYFQPVVSGHDPDSYELLIFNRWGELIFESYNSELKWDGYHKGQPVKQDVYVWKLRVKKLSDGERKDFYGHVTVLR